MKIFCRALFMAILMAFLIYPVRSETFGMQSCWLSAGSTGSNVSFAIGGRWKYVGFEIGGASIPDDPPDGLLPYAVPHTSFRNIGSYELSNPYGADLLGFIHPTDKIALYGGIGWYTHTYKDLAQSTVTGWYYTQSEFTRDEVAFSGGIHYKFKSHPVFGDLIIGAGYHEVRGMQATFGFLY